MSLPAPSRRRLHDVLLVVLVLAALLLALAGIVDDGGRVPDDAIALVNGRPLGRAGFEDSLAAVERELRAPLDAAGRAEVLERFIDEELLLQQAIALDLPRKDARLRGQMMQQIIRQAVAAAPVTPPDDATLERFLAANASYFRRPATFRAWRVLAADADEAAALAAALARGGAQHQLHAELLARRDPTLPDAWLTRARLAEYLGDATAGRVVALQPGALLRDAADARVLLLLAGARPESTPPLAAIRAQVEAEWSRRHDEQALRDYVRGLRAAARIVRAEPAS